MLDFIYDSLDTVKKLKFPTFKQITRLTLGIFALVIIAGLYLILVDTIFSDGYKGFYTLMTNQSLDSQQTNGGLISGDTNTFSGIDLSNIQAEVGSGESPVTAEWVLSGTQEGTENPVQAQEVAQVAESTEVTQTTGTQN